MIPTLVPVEDYVVVRVDAPETTSQGGLVIPDRDADKPEQGVAVAVGPGRFTERGVQIPCMVEVGQRVLFGTYRGEYVVLDGVKHLVVRERDLLGVYR